jgi:lysophospholipase L1-like esterase
MKIYFDGCSITYGKELSDIPKQRYSKLVCDKLQAEEYNIAANGGSNHRIMRNLVDNLGKFDMYIIQMTKRMRLEWYDERYVGQDDKWGKREWQRVRYPPSPHTTGNTEFWERYYKEIYHDEFGKSDEKIYYHSIRALLQNVPHVLLWAGHYKFDLPVDLSYGYKVLPRAERGHPNEKGHYIIYSDIIKFIDEKNIL